MLFRPGIVYVAAVLFSHAKRWLVVYLCVAVAGIWFHQNYRLGINLSDSLPHKVFLVSFNGQPSQRGEYVAFRWGRDSFYDRSWMFVKRIEGTAGQKITVAGRHVYIDGKFVGTAKPTSRGGVPLHPIAAGTIPEGAFFVSAPNKDSLDSRYAITGLIDKNRVIGTAYALF